MSEKSKSFSKGKWYSDGEIVFVDKGTFSAAICTLNQPRDYEAGERELVANGNLIAAAPEMYEILDQLTRLGGGVTGLIRLTRLQSEAQAILKKARGEE